MIVYSSAGDNPLNPLIKRALVALGRHLIGWPAARRAITWAVQRGGLVHA